MSLLELEDEFAIAELANPVLTIQFLGVPQGREFRVPIEVENALRYTRWDATLQSHKTTISQVAGNVIRIFVPEYFETPGKLYHFVGWEDGTKTNVRNYTMQTTNTAIAATYEEISTIVQARWIPILLAGAALGALGLVLFWKK